MQYSSAIFLAVTLAKAYGASCSGDVTVKSQSDLDNIASCDTYKGDLNFGSSVSGDVTLNGVQSLKGDLVINNATSLGALSAPSLVNISGAFEIQAALELSALNFPELTSVGSINWVTIPAISGLSFTKGVTSAGSVVISDTGLTSLDGIEVIDVSTFNINNNRYLTEINVGLQTVSDALEISSNSQDAEVSFPYLKWANNITFRDVSSASLPNITNVNSSIGYINNTIPGVALPELTAVGGSFALVSNSKMSNVSVSKLKTIGGGLQIANNTHLGSVLGFPKLKSVGGAIEIVGNFSSADLPSLNLVKGGVEIESSSSKFNCSSWNSLHSDGDIQGDSYECKAASSSTSVALSGSSTKTSDSSSSGSATSAAASTTSSSKSKGGAAAMGVSYELTGLAGVLAAFFFQLV